MHYYFTAWQVAEHCYPDDIWVVVKGRVLDITPLVKENRASRLLNPILQSAGKDISHWFDEKLNVKTCIDIKTGIRVIYAPLGRFLGCLVEKESDTLPWWKDDKFYLGELTKQVFQHLESREDYKEAALENRSQGMLGCSLKKGQDFGIIDINGFY